MVLLEKRPVPAKNSAGLIVFVVLSYLNVLIVFDD